VIVKARRILLGVMFYLWALGVSVMSVLIAIGLLLGDFIMRLMGKRVAQDVALKEKRRKYSLNE
jgi:hypothetical protein